MTLLPLPEREIHVWWTLLDCLNDPDEVQQCLALLSDSERRRWQRFVFPSGRQEYLLSHVLVRRVLSRYAPIEPREWCFAANSHGKPWISGPALSTDLRFNLSHSHGMAAVAVARGLEIGIDVENITRRPDTEEIASRFFAPLEVAQLRAAAPATHTAMFFEVWTLKEAYIKARGLGLSIPLASFAFTLSPSQPPVISFFEGCTDSADRWQFFQFIPALNFRMALAVPVSRKSDCTVLCRQVVPFDLVSKLV